MFQKISVILVAMRDDIRLSVVTPKGNNNFRATYGYEIVSNRQASGNVKFELSAFGVNYKLDSMFKAVEKTFAATIIFNDGIDNHKIGVDFETGKLSGKYMFVITTP